MDERISVVLSAVDNVSRPLKNMQRSFDYFSKTAEMGIGALTDETKKMAQELRAANKKSRDSLYLFRNEMIKVEHGYLKLTEAADKYAGRTGDFMDEVVKLGKQQKKITDQMIANDDRAKRSFVQSIGTLLARSTQSEKIAANFDRMNNPLYQVNNGLLRVTQNFEKMAKAGQPAALALKMLGPTASMKELQDMTTLINRGLMRYQMVALSAAVASGVLYTALFKVAKGPDPGKIYQKQEEALAEYEKAVRERTTEILHTWGFFEEAQAAKTNPKRILKNLESQVNVLREWRTNLAKVIARGIPKELQNELEDLGPAVAGNIKAMASMSDAELKKYVELYQERFKLAKDAAVSELEELKAETDRKVKALQESLTPLGLALEPMKQAWAEAFKPMVEAFAAVAVPIVNFLTKIGEMIVKFNEAHPTMAKFIQSVLMLIPILTLLLSPLAIGIGLFGGLSAAFAQTWMLIGPLVTGLAAMLGTVILVAAAIVGLVMAFTTAYQKIEWFRNMVDTAWAAIKNAFNTALNFIIGIVQTVMAEVSSFFGEQLEKVKALWDEHGAFIMSVVTGYLGQVWATIQMYMGIIKGIFQAVWPIISNVVKVAWELIKTVIGTNIDVIVGLIDAAMSLLQGDWEGAWDAIKGIAEDIWHNIEDFFSNIDLVQIGKDIIQGLIDGIGSMAGAVADRVSEMAGGIKDKVMEILGIHSPSRVMRDQVGKWIPIGLADGIDEQMRSVQTAANRMASTVIDSASLSKIDPQVSALVQSSATLEPASDEGPQIVNFERLFDGATINVREERDIKALAVELYNLQQNAKARKGVR